MEILSASQEKGLGKSSRMAPLPPQTSCILGVPVGAGGCWVPLSPGSCSEMPGGVFFGVVVTFFSFFLYITAQDVVAVRLSTAIFFFQR